jgi:hypothetical protein
VPLGKLYLRVFRFSSATVIPPLVHIRSCIIREIDSGLLTGPATQRCSLNHIVTIKSWSVRASTVAARSGLWVWATRTSELWVRNYLEAWIHVRIFMCFAVLCRLSYCKGLICYQSSHTNCRKRFRKLPEKFFRKARIRLQYSGGM